MAKSSSHRVQHWSPVRRNLEPWTLQTLRTERNIERSLGLERLELLSSPWQAGSTPWGVPGKPALQELCSETFGFGFSPLGNQEPDTGQCELESWGLGRLKYRNSVRVLEISGILQLWKLGTVST